MTYNELFSAIDTNEFRTAYSSRYNDMFIADDERPVKLCQGLKLFSAGRRLNIDYMLSEVQRRMVQTHEADIRRTVYEALLPDPTADDADEQIRAILAREISIAVADKASRMMFATELIHYLA